MNHETQSIWEASFLMANGCKLEGKRKEGKKTTLLFKDSKEVKKLSMDFYNNETVRAKDFSDNYRTLKDYLFQV